MPKWTIALVGSLSVSLKNPKKRLMTATIHSTIVHCREFIWFPYVRTPRSNLTLCVLHARQRIHNLRTIKW